MMPTASTYRIKRLRCHLSRSESFIIGRCEGNRAPRRSPNLKRGCEMLSSSLSMSRFAKPTLLSKTSRRLTAVVIVVTSSNDLWIAACARRHGIPIVSNNRKHFEGIPGITLISEAPSPPAPPSQPELFKDSAIPLDPPTSG